MSAPDDGPARSFGMRRSGSSPGGPGGANGDNVDSHKGEELLADDAVVDVASEEASVHTQEVLERAMGGVLFVDEAYYLYRQENERDYGQETIEILLQVWRTTERTSWSSSPAPRRLRHRYRLGVEVGSGRER